MEASHSDDFKVVKSINDTKPLVPPSNLKSYSDGS